MKPAYEIVRAAELRVGDVFKADARGADEVVLDVDPETETVTTPSGPWGFKRLVARQLPPERNPDVLMRVLKMTCTRLRDIDWESSEADPSGFINQAIRELESEAGK